MLFSEKRYINIVLVHMLVLGKRFIYNRAKNLGMKKGVLGVASFMALVLSSVAAYAVVLPEQAKKLLEFIFIDLSKLGISGDASALIAFKFMTWILVFTLIYFGLTKSGVFGEKKNIAVVISIILALMTTIMLPGALVMTLFQTYSFIVGIVLIALPIVLGIWLGTSTFKESTKFNYFMRGLILFVIAYVLGALLTSLLVTGQALYMKLYDWGVWGVIGCVVAGIVNMLRIAGAGGTKSGWGVPEAGGAPGGSGAQTPPTIESGNQPTNQARTQALSAAQENAIAKQLEAANQQLRQSEAHKASDIVSELNQLEDSLRSLKDIGETLKKAGG
jgi:hypothetical protein